MQRINTDRNFVLSDSRSRALLGHARRALSLDLVLLEIRDNYLFVVLVVHVCPSLIQSNSVDDQTTPVLEWRGRLDQRDASEHEHRRAYQGHYMEGSVLVALELIV